MLVAALVGSALLAAAPPEAPTADVQAAYREARAAAGRDPEAHVELALWCETHGLDAQRLRHLGLALLADPTNAAARGLLGLVRDGDAWRKPEAVAARVHADAELNAALAEYEAHRARADATADGPWRLALWCEEHGLDPEMRAHLAAVLRLDPSRKGAWLKLGYKQRDGRWVTDEQLAREKAERDAQEQANKHWLPLLTTWRGQLDDRDHRAEALHSLAGVDDPRAVPSILRVFGGPDESDQGLAVQLFGQIDDQAASQALAMYSVLSDSAAVRRQATESLRNRDPREFAGLLIAMLRDPIRYEVRPVGGPGSPGVLFVEGEQFNVSRLYAPPAMPSLAIQPGDFLGVDQYGLPLITRIHTTVQDDHVRDGLSQAEAESLIHAFYGPMPTYVPFPRAMTDQYPVLQQLNQMALQAEQAPWRATEQYLHDQLALQGNSPHKTVNEHIMHATTFMAQFPIGQMAIEARRAAVSAQRQLTVCTEIQIRT